MADKVLFVEKKQSFNVEGNGLKNEFVENLNLEIDEVRVINRYIISSISEEALEISKYTVFAEKTVDDLYEEHINLEGYKVFGTEYLKGQYDQRADAAEECVQILTLGEKPAIRYSKFLAIKGNLSETDLIKIKKYFINPVDSKEAFLKYENLQEEKQNNETIEVLENFIDLCSEDLEKLYKELGLAMTIEDFKLCRNYFKEENRNPKITEIKVIDTYWSDHCRHTTFLTSIKNVEIEAGDFKEPINIALNEYLETRNFVGRSDRDITLMDIATISARELKKKGFLKDLDESDEINACTIKANIETDNGMEEYLILFKNETHNHPTEIEPFGGAATCLGGAIRDPLSGRAYVYQAMRVTGSGNPLKTLDQTIKGKLPQRTITKGAARGYSSYGNQIGLATGEVCEIYDEDFVAKRMEVGAVIGAVPKKQVKREEPKEGDVVVLLGGRTGRDGLGGATGSSKEHTVESIDICGAEVQKGNAPVERKIQRFFRKEEVSSLIKRCNDFGAGGVSVAIGELSDGIDINLDVVPKKYEGLDGTELAISESQERMAVVIDRKDLENFLNLAKEENLEATHVADITSKNRVRMFWRGDTIVDLDRDFLNTNGAKSYADVKVKSPIKEDNFFNINKSTGNFSEDVMDVLKDLNVCSQKGLSEMFDSTIGRGSVLMPWGGKFQLTKPEGMAGKIPVFRGDSKDCSLMTFGYNSKIGKFSPFHGAFYAVIESVCKIVALGGDYKKIHLTFQEYFEKLGSDKEKWGKPFSALLGAFHAQKNLNLAAIGGKDSMSGTFEDLTVPPTLISFAVAIEKCANVMSPELKSTNSVIVEIQTLKDKNEILDFNSLKNNLELVKSLVDSKKALSILSLKENGIIEGILKMSFGNKIGVKIEDSIDEKELFSPKYGNFLVEMDCENLDSLKNVNYKVVGKTTNLNSINYKENNLNIDNLICEWEKPLNSVFKIKDSVTLENIEIENSKIEISDKKIISPLIKTPKPKVFIPSFPGTNCEWDSEQAFLKAGGDVSQLVFKNMTKDHLNESLKAFEKQIRNSQILMIPGGFSAGDEPEGSGKFIANVLKNPRIKESVMDLLQNRDGLIIGICNGFQALIKVGLIPYGEIRDLNENGPTLTYNTIGRHVSSVVKTKIVTNDSPWLQNVNIGDIHNVVVSHGEGRFVASEEEIKALIKNGQIATQYVDLNGNAACNMPHNPNGSMFGVEGVLSPCKRVIGKMGHSERIGENLYKNIDGNFDQKIFESGVNYFK